MTTFIRPYPDYQHSGLPWLGRIPAHWQVRRNGSLFAQRNETGYGQLPILEVSFNTGVRVRGFEGSSRKQVMSDREKYKRAVQGDIAYNMMRLWQGAVGVVPTDGLVSPAYVVARPFPGTISPYFIELYRTDACKVEVNKYSHGIVSDRNRLYWDEFKQMPVCVPPPEEQISIVRFLAYVDQDTRRFIQAKRRLIELLKEQKQAVVHDLLTHGSGCSSFINSGQEHLGRIPSHWSVSPLKRVARLHRGYDLPDYQRIPGEYPVVSSGGIIGTHSRGLVRGPGVVTGRYGSTGKVYYLETDFWPHNTSLYVSEFFGNLPRYIFYLLQTLAIDAHSGKSAVPGVDRKDLHEIPVAVVPRNEQAAIVVQLDQSQAEFDKRAQIVETTISTIHEYRTRLIADVVTGKLDVREAAERLPSSVDEVVRDDDPLGLSIPGSVEMDDLDDDAPELLPVAADED